MHPPFIYTDHRVRPDPHQSRVKKRNKPEPLRLQPSAEGWPPLPVIAPKPDSSPTGLPYHTGLRIHVAPQERSTFRDWLGRLLIRTGQRLIPNNHPS